MMKAVHLRPLCLFCLVFYFSAGAIWRGGAEKAFFGAALAISAAALFVYYVKNKGGLWIRSVSLALAALSAAFLFTWGFVDLHKAAQLQLCGEGEVQMRVKEVLWSTSYSGAYIVDMKEVNGEKCRAEAILNMGGDFSRGDVLRGDCLIGEQEAEEGQAQYAGYWGSRGIYLQLKADKLSLCCNSKTVFDEMLFLNDSLSERLSELMGEREGGIASAIFLGNDRCLSQKFENSMRNMGTSHLTALSGMHLTIVCCMLSLFLSKLGKRASLLATVLPVLFYVFLTGCSASILRAGIMLICVNLISFIGRDSDLPTNLAIALALICSADHYAVYDMGLQLSAAAMLGIIAAGKLTRVSVYRPLGSLRAAARRLFFPLCIGLFSMTFTMPLLYNGLGRFSPWSFLTTLPLSLIVTAILWLTPFVLLLGSLPFVGSLLSFWLKWLCRILYDIASSFGFSNGLTVSEDSMLIKTLMIALVIVVCATAVVDAKKLRRIGLGASAALAAAFIIATAAITGINLDKVTFISVEGKSGDGFALRHKNGCVLVDISSGSGSFSASLADAASQLSINSANVLLIADPHSSHIKAVERMLELMAIESVFLPETEEGFFVGAGLEGIAAVEYYEAGDIIDLGAYRLVTYEDQYISRSVVPIIRLRVEAAERSLDYRGSAYSHEAEAESEAEGNIVWLGSYGPKYKEDILIREGAELIVSDKASGFTELSPSYEIGERIYLSEG